MKITAKLMYINVAIISIAIICSTLFSIVQMNREAARQANAVQERSLKVFWELLRHKGTEFRIVDGKLMVDNYVINGNYELPDKIKEIFGGTATIFMGDVRVSTNVEKDDGSRAIGTRLSGPAYDAIFRNGMSYRGEAPILGTPYFTAYDPIRNKEGQVVGVLFVGMKKNDFFQTYNRLAVNQALAAISLITIFTFFTLILMRALRKAEVALIESEERMKSILHGSPIPQFVIDSNHRVIYWNRAMERLTGRRSEDIVGTSDHCGILYETYHPTMVDILVDRKSAEMDNWYGGKWSKSKILENAFEATDYFPSLGKEGKWLHFTATLVNDSKGEVIAAVETLQDITGHKQAEEALRKANMVVENSPVVLFRCKAAPGWPVELVSKNVVQFGYMPEEFLSGKLTYSSIVHPHDLERLMTETEDFSSGGRGQWIQEYRIVTKDGDIRWIIDETVCMRDTEGKITHYEGVVIDITERKHTEEELQEQFHFLQELIDDIPNPVFVRSVSGQYMLSNKAFEDYLGLKKGNVLGKTVFDLHPKEEADECFTTDMALIDSMDTSLVTDGTVSTANGSRLDILCHKAKYFTKEGSLGGIIGTFMDISERKRMENAMRESEERFRRAFDQSPVGAAIISLDYRILRVNEQWCRITGYSEQELKEFALHDISHADDMAKELLLKKDLLAGTLDVLQMDKRYLHKDGRVIWARLSECLLKSVSGEPLHFLHMMEDITAKKRLEEEMLKSQKLESLGVLAGGIAHDFNNLLTGILGNINLAKIMTVKQSKAHKNLAEAEKASLRARDLTFQLLTFSRGGAPIKKVASIGEIIMDATAFALRGSNVKCEFSIPEDIRLVEVDEGQFSQVIQNLVINADQAMPTGGLISLSAANATHIPANLPSDGNYIRISIQDTGTGIPEENLTRIFDPYFTTKPKGSGLGLSSVYSIIKNHGGLIEVVSTVGEGTTFHIYLPASSAPRLAEKPEKAEPVHGKGRILLMDDEEIIRLTGEDILTELGYTVTVCNDGASMLDLYEAARKAGQVYDLVILDLTIPGGMGGKEAMARLLKIDPKVRGIVSSGYNNDPILASYLECGFCGVVTKPYTVDEIGEVVQAVLHRK